MSRCFSRWAPHLFTVVNTYIMFSKFDVSKKLDPPCVGLEALCPKQSMCQRQPVYLFYRSIVQYGRSSDAVHQACRQVCGGAHGLPGFRRLRLATKAVEPLQRRCDSGPGESSVPSRVPALSAFYRFQFTTQTARTKQPILACSPRALSPFRCKR